MKPEPAHPAGACRRLAAAALSFAIILIIAGIVMVVARRVLGRSSLVSLDLVVSAPGCVVYIPMGSCILIALAVKLVTWAVKTPLRGGLGRVSVKARS